MSGVRFWGLVFFLGALAAPKMATAETLWTHIPDPVPNMSYYHRKRPVNGG